MSRFVSEQQIEEQKKRRREEWESNPNRGSGPNPDDLPYDPRPLYEKLAEQARLKEEQEKEKSKMGLFVCLFVFLNKKKRKKKKKN